MGKIWEKWDSLFQEVEGKKHRLEGCRGGQLHFVVKEREFKGLGWKWNACLCSRGWIYMCGLNALLKGIYRDQIFKLSGEGGRGLNLGGNIEECRAMWFWGTNSASVLWPRKNPEKLNRVEIGIEESKLYTNIRCLHHMKHGLYSFFLPALRPIVGLYFAAL